MTITCPALLVSAPASGQGKTTATAALARRFRDRGLKVRVFKTGPDFIDPGIHEAASGHPVYQLDLFMTGEADCRQRLGEAAQTADLILIEGAMGLFDGDPSSADIAARFGLPVLAVIDAAAMAQTFAAVAHGLATWRADVNVAGVLANRVGSAGHGELLRLCLPPHIAWYGALPREAALALPERHLGLVRGEEVADLEARLHAAAAALPEAVLDLPQPVAFATPAATTPPALLAGVRIAIARDDAFAFIYPANLDLLAAMGAQLRFFSPVAGATLPECDAVWLPGGYPELRLAALAGNSALAAGLHAHHAAGKPIVAECGGMLYLAESLCDVAGECAPMAGLLPAHARMQPRLAGLGLQAVELPEGALRGHTFHHSRLETDLAPLTRATNPNGGAGEAVYRQGRLTASYVHFYFPSNPEAAARLFLP